MAAPREPSKAERDVREAPRCLNAAWCADCVAERGLRNPGERVPEIEGTPCHRMTTCAARRNETAHQVTNAMDNVHRKTVSICCARKSGCDQFTTRCLQPYAESLGFEKVTIPCDPENAAKDDAMRVMRDIPNEPKKQLCVTFRTNPRSSN